MLALGCAEDALMNEVIRSLFPLKAGALSKNDNRISRC